MKPLLFSLHLGGREVGLHTYGVLIAVGFTIGITLAWRQGRRLGLDGGKVLDLAFWILVSGLIGSRLLFVLINAADFARVCSGDGTPRSASTLIGDCSRPLQVWEGGLVFYGGVLAAVGTTALFVRKQGWSLPRIADLFAPSLAIGHFFGRLGCFAAGCCFGKACNGAMGVSFPPGSVAFDELRQLGHLGSRALTPPLHPTQLYEAAGELAIFAMLLWLQGRKRFHGQLVLAYALGYALLRTVVEIFRGDVARRFVVEVDTPALARALGLPPAEPTFLSISQLISLLVIVTATWLLIRLRSASPDRKR